MPARNAAALLALLEIIQLITDLDETRWTGRPRYGIRAMIGAAVVTAGYARQALLAGNRGGQRLHQRGEAADGLLIAVEAQVA